MDTAASSERSPRFSFSYRRGSRRRSGNNLSVDELREDEKTIKKLKLENRKLRRRFVEESEDLRLLREQFQQQLVIMRAMKMQLDNVALTTKFQKSAEVEIADKLGESMQQLCDFETYQKAILKIAQTILDPPTPESSDDEEEEIPPRTLAQQNLFYSEKVLEKYNRKNQVSTSTITGSWSLPESKQVDQGLPSVHSKA
ncbi:unnamed protein product [Linum trigynum]|uniref:Uncharacterized protein n=1 Tax=Linum trigynum TaxID=586398 RepID=A0AAV2FN35_9ROSI